MEIQKVAYLFGQPLYLEQPAIFESVSWPGTKTERRDGLFDLCGRAAMSVLTETIARVVSDADRVYPRWCRVFSAALSVAVDYANYDILSEKLQWAGDGLSKPKYGYA